MRRPPPVGARHRSLRHVMVMSVVAAGALLAFYLSPGFPSHTSDASVVASLSLPGVGPGRPAATVLTSSVLPKTVSQQELTGALTAIASGQPAATAKPGGEAAAASAPPAIYQLYAVQSGDTASAIASRFGVELHYLLDANPDVADGQLLSVGQMLIIPSSNGVLHHMHYGETLTDVAAEFGVPVSAIIDYGGNNIASPDQVAENQLVFIPNGVLSAPAPAAAPTETQPPPVVVSAAPSSPGPVSAAQPGGSVSGHGLIWPVTGPISSYMGPSHPLGIDIDLYATPYTGIHAATSGTVIFAGGDPCCSYGYHVIIMSPNGIETVYAHFSSIGVSTGQTVNQGDILGISGCTGYCTGNHLHFEVIDNGVRVNPLDYLP